jgi:hypothetical protein
MWSGLFCLSFHQLDVLQRFPIASLGSVIAPRS